VPSRRNDRTMPALAVSPFCSDVLPPFRVTFLKSVSQACTPVAPEGLKVRSG
jgi:hypothetical protein